MAHAAILLVLVVGCGRIQFDDVDRDRDSDGIADEIDLCPDFDSSNQHDEDGDGAGDVCDPCPHLAGDAADADGDGVGDACDPHPAEPREQIREFLTFETAPSWLPTLRGATTTAEEWQFDDAARTALIEDHVAMLTIASPAADVRIETALVIDAIAPMGGNPARNFAIIDNYNTVTDTGLFYGAVSDYQQGPPATASILFVLNSVGNMILGEVPLDPTFHVGEPYHLTYTRAGSTRSYVLDGLEGVRPLSASRSDGGGSIGIRSRGLTIAFQYVIVIY